METLYRLFSGLVAAVAAVMAPAVPIISTALVFIGVDFLSGIAADRATAHREGRRWFFESHKAWHTVVKASLTVTAIAMGWLLDVCVAEVVNLHVARLLAGFTCGVELWSFLENAAQLSDAPFFRTMRRFLRRRIGEEVGDES